jgi:hypothetical protein
MCVYPFNDDWNHCLRHFAGVDHAEQAAASEEQSVVNEGASGHDRLHVLLDN